MFGALRRGVRPTPRVREQPSLLFSPTPPLLIKSMLVCLGYMLPTPTRRAQACLEIPHRTVHPNTPTTTDTNTTKPTDGHGLGPPERCKRRRPRRRPPHHPIIIFFPLPLLLVLVADGRLGVRLALPPRCVRMYLPTDVGAFMCVGRMSDRTYHTHTKTTQHTQTTTNPTAPTMAPTAP